MSVREINFNAIFKPGKSDLDYWNVPFPKLFLVFDLSKSMEEYRDEIVQDIEYIFEQYTKHKDLHPGNFNIGFRFFSNDMEYGRCTFYEGDRLKKIHPERMNFVGRSAILYNLYGLLSGYHSGGIQEVKRTPGLRRDVIIWTDGKDNASIEEYRDLGLVKDLIAERKEENIHVHWAIANLEDLRFDDRFDDFESNPHPLGAASLLQRFNLSWEFMFALETEGREFPKENFFRGFGNGDVGFEGNYRDDGEPPF